MLVVVDHQESIGMKQRDKARHRVAAKRWFRIRKEPESRDQAKLLPGEGVATGEVRTEEVRAWQGDSGDPQHAARDVDPNRSSDSRLKEAENAPGSTGEIERCSTREPGEPAEDAT
jgi:hypothetical protein